MRRISREGVQFKAESQRNPRYYC